jgi:hypothetical protein
VPADRRSRRVLRDEHLLEPIGGQPGNGRHAIPQGEKLVGYRESRCEPALLEVVSVSEVNYTAPGGDAPEDERLERQGFNLANQVFLFDRLEQAGKVAPTFGRRGGDRPPSPRSSLHDPPMASCKPSGMGAI